MKTRTSLEREDSSALKSGLMCEEVQSDNYYSLILYSIPIFVLFHLFIYSFLFTERRRVIVVYL